MINESELAPLDNASVSKAKTRADNNSQSKLEIADIHLEENNSGDDNEKPKKSKQKKKSRSRAREESDRSGIISEDIESGVVSKRLRNKKKRGEMDQSDSEVSKAPKSHRSRGRDKRFVKKSVVVDLES